jgi:outer membrane lipoprotein carrier protein
MSYLPYLFYLFSLLTGLSLPLAGLAADGPADRLHRFLDGLQTLQARFEQLVVVPGQDAVSQSAGTLYLSRPGRFRWAYDQPAGQLVVADGDRVWLYDPELEQVSHQAQADALRGTPALLLSDTGPIEDQFQVSAQEPHLGLDWVQLEPRAENSEIVRILVGFAGERLAQLEMLDSFGQLTRFRFREVQRNPALDPDLFRYRPPPGLDILGR